MQEYLSNLNDQQRDAVTFCDGPQLVIAGAGSGKTRVLTYKIVHLLAHGYEPWRILALTFTNKAAREMRERIQALVGEKIASKLWMGTFHSIFARILRANADKIGFKSSFTIYDSPDSKSLIKMIIKDMDLDDKVYKPSVVANAISTAKNALIGPDAYANDYDIRQADKRAKRDRLWEIYAAYVNRCHLAGAMDFDDLLYYTNVLFRDYPDVKRHYAEWFRYVLVDEYQDTNFAQHVIVLQLTEGANDLCVVGDDAQSIYSFRGANIRNILNLKRAYPNLQTFKLEENYRSTQNIINAANSLIEKNKQQIPKKVFSRKAVGNPVEVVKSYSDYEEAYLVANSVSQRHMQSKDSYEEFAILYRTNAQSRVLEEALRKRNIPYRIYGGLSFYQRKEIKDAIAYFRLSINPNDDEALKRVINYPARGIGETTLRKLSRYAIDHNMSIWGVISDMENLDLGLNKGTIAKVAEFRNLLASFANLNANGADAAKVATRIISDSRLLAVLVSDRTPESISKQENLQELLNGVQEFVVGKEEEGNTEQIFMQDYLAEVSLLTDQDEKEIDAAERVTMMTIHAAKGLEFGNVFIVGVEEDLLPSALSQDSPDEVEEERRLLYVAITRAKRFCMMSYASSRFRNGTTIDTRPSRFINDIDRQFLKFPLGSESALNAFDTINKFKSSFHSAPTPWSRRQPSPSSPSNSSLLTTHSKLPSSSNSSLLTTHSKLPSSSSSAHTHSPEELSTGMRIEHERFGKGVIIDIDTSQVDPRIRVNFDNVDVKTLILKYAKFRIL